MLARVLILACALATASGCIVCERETAADGEYDIVTDCTGPQLTQGLLQIGAFGPGMPVTTTTETTTCSMGDCSTVSSTTESEVCADTGAAGASTLGLPSDVEVLGEGRFALHGQIGGRRLDCTPQDFGDETLLFCRSEGCIVCVAVVRSAWSDVAY